MTYKEAIKDFKVIKALLESSHSLLLFVNNRNDCIAQCNIAIECIEKQIAKKPKIEINSYPYNYTEVRDDDYRIVCPTCGREVDEYENKHHCECGQKLDWQEVEF